MKEIGTARIFGLDLMRAVAILLVLGSHMLFNFPDVTDTFLVAVLRLGGVMGVELFFVLSGFLIGRILYRIYCAEHFKTADLRYFLIRRWFRTLPNYYVILLLNILLVFTIRDAVPGDVWSYFFFVQNFSSGMGVFFTESWSLPIEEWAYVVAPILLVLLGTVLNKQKAFAPSSVFLMTVMVLIITPLLLKIGYNYQSNSTTLLEWNKELKAVVLYRLDAIFYGVLAAYLSRKYADLWKRYRVESFVMGALVFFGFQFCLVQFSLTIEAAPWAWNILYLPVASLSFCFLLPFLSTFDKVGAFLRTPITVISKISYAIYLLHYGLIIQMMRWLWPIDGMTVNERLGYTVIYLAIVFVVSYAWYHFFEKPIMDLRDRPIFKS